MAKGDQFHKVQGSLDFVALSARCPIYVGERGIFS